MKKIFSILLIILAALLVPFYGCNGTSSSASSDNSISDSSSGENDNLQTVEDKILLEKLKESPFSSAVRSDENWGLNDISAVGINEEKFNNEILYFSLFGDYKRVSAEEFGVTTSGTKNSVNLNNYLRTLEGSTEKTEIYFEKGTYRFTDTIKLENIKNVHFCGDDAEFVFSVWTTAFKTVNVENILFSKISVDYDPSPTVSGTVKSYNADEKSITISLFDEFNLSNVMYNGGKINYGSYMEFIEDEYTKKLIPDVNGNLLYNSTGDRISNIKDGIYNRTDNTLKLTFASVKAVKAGTNVSVAFTMYEYPTVKVENSKNIYFEDFSVYTSAGMTFYFESTENIYLNKLRIALKEGSKRLMTSTADSLHCIDCHGKIILTNSLFENSHDDSINVHSFYKTIISNQAKKIECVSSGLQADYPIEVNDVIEIYDPKSFELKGSFTVKDVEKAGVNYSVTVDKMITSDYKNFIVGNVTRSPLMTVKNNLFRNKRNRGILLQTRNSIIENNAFVNVIHGAISIHSSLDIFAEAIVPKNITVRGNKFIACNSGHGLEGEVSVFANGTSGRVPGAITYINIENNFFYSSSYAGVSLTGAGNVNVNNNFYYDVALKLGLGGSAVNVLSSTLIDIYSNALVMSNGKIDFVKEVESTNISQSNNVVKGEAK